MYTRTQQTKNSSPGTPFHPLWKVHGHDDAFPASLTPVTPALCDRDEDAGMFTGWKQGMGASR